MFASQNKWHLMIQPVRWCPSFVHIILIVTLIKTLPFYLIDNKKYN